MNFIIALFQSLIYQYVTIRLENKYGIFIDSDTKAHAIHTIPTPRVGGLGIFFAFAISVMVLMPQYWWLVVSGFVIFGFGLYEDWHGDTRKELRLASMAIATYMAIYFGGYVADNSELFILPYAVAVAFTLFATVGMSSAINFIDGLNGLASGLCMIVLVFFAGLAYWYGDTELFSLIVILIGAIGGFFIWNYPRGKIFLGDGGAYFLGFVLAMIAVILAARHDEISLWYTLVALSYPVIETFVTIDRRINRKRKYGIPFFEAEKVHLHTLKFRRCTKDNASATRRILLFNFYINLAAVIVHQSVAALILVSIIVYVVYITKYKKIVRFGCAQNRDQKLTSNLLLPFFTVMGKRF